MNYRQKAQECWSIRDAAIDDIIDSGQECTTETQAQYLEALAEMAMRYEEAAEIGYMPVDDCTAWAQETQDLRHGG